MIWPKRFLILVSLAAVGFPARLLSAQSVVVAQKIDRQVHVLVDKFPGSVSLSAKNLDTGASYGLRADDPVPTASTIKVAIMIELFAEAQEGRLDWNQKIELTDRDKVGGTGVLQEFSAGDLLPIRDLMHLMIVVSDNTATNLILNRIGGDAVNVRMAQLGLRQTAVMRKIMQQDGVTAEGAKPQNQQWGIARSSPRDMVVIMEKLYRGELVSKAASQEMIAVLKRQQNQEGIGRDMKDTVIASKAGALDHLRSGVGIVYSPHGPIALAITVNNIPEVDYGVDNPGNILISRLSEILVEGLATGARSRK